MHCQSCGTPKDPSAPEVYPYPDDGLTDRPIDPLMEVAVEPSGGRWKSATVCHHCFHRLSPDLWISRACWESLNPAVGFDQLPDKTASESGTGGV